MKTEMALQERTTQLEKQLENLRKERQNFWKFYTEERQALQSYERWLNEVLTDFKIPFEDHAVGKRIALLNWMQEHK